MEHRPTPAGSIDPTPAPSPGPSPAPTTGAEKRWPIWVRVPVLLIGVAASGLVGYLMMMVTMFAAVVVGAAPLLASSTTPQQPWVTPVAVAVGVIVFGIGAWLSTRTFRRRS